MGEWFENLFSQLAALSPARRMLLALSAMGSLAFFGWVVFGGAAPEYRAVFRGLPEDEAARVAEALAAEQIDYQLADGGTAVLVPAVEVAEARIRLAGKGLPSGGSAGFELFDKPAFGVTDFVHRVNYLRAVQGELARSIEQLDPVERARVQVVIPERRNVLSREERAPSASVVVRLRPGHELATEQVQAVVHLVASGLESLDAANVTVVDGSGRLLAPLEDGMPGSLGATGVSNYQERVEAELANRIETILEKTAGPDSVVARVRADLDWTEVETTEEVFDPDSQVARSERRSTETNNDEASGTAGGVPGVAANVPGGDAAFPPEPAVSSSRETETINYEISKSVSRRVVPMGRVERLSIAVLVADPIAPEGAEESAAPWTPEDLSLFEALARQAVGFDADRGDQITVRSAPFHAPEAIPLDAPSFWPQWSPLIVTLLRGLVAVVALLLFARLVVQPVVAALPEPAAAAPVAAAGLEEGGAGDLEALGGSAATAALGAGGVAPATEDGARALKNWLNQS
ncbi:MAG: flagellar basal-body MS-ring/collar protein FliF [Myxococcota bacterium]